MTTIIYWLLCCALGAALSHNGLHAKTAGFWIIMLIVNGMVLSFKFI